MAMTGLFGTEWMRVNDGIVYPVEIDDTGFVISPDDCEGYVCLCARVMMPDGSPNTIYSSFRPTEKNNRALLRALGIPPNSFNHNLDDLFKGKTVNVLFGRHADGEEFMRLYKNCGEITLKGE